MSAENRTAKALSLTEQKLLKTLSGRGQDLFTTRDAEQVLDKPNPSVRKLLHGLVKSRWLRRLEKGKYLIVPLSAGEDAHYTANELVIAAHLIMPYYVSYWTALSHYAYTEQPTRTVYIATPKRRKPLEWRGVTYRFVTLAQHKFFGHARVWIGDQAVEIATREKTLVDGLDHPEFCGGIVQVARGLWRGRDETDLAKVCDDARRMKNRAIVKRLGYLLERLDLGSVDLRASLAAQRSKGYTVLDPLSPREGKHNARWRLLVNLSDADLLSWKET